MTQHDDIIEPVFNDVAELKLERLAGFSLDASGDEAAYTPGMVAWLEAEIAGSATPAERRAIESAAERLVTRVTSRASATRVGESIRRYELRDVAADVVGSIGEVAGEAASRGCVPWADSFAVAAGTGRELWDEPCERWIELPTGLRAAPGLIAIGVAGDSMMPYLADGDVIVVDTRARVVRDRVVVARRPDGYVVKLVKSVTRAALELSSFNQSYAPFTVAREPGSVVGIVVARLTRQ